MGFQHPTTSPESPSLGRDKASYLAHWKPSLHSICQTQLELELPKMKPEDVHAKLEEGRRHLHFIIGLYRLQVDQGRHFLHEHPESASSWADPWMVQLLQHPRVKSVVQDQCEYGLVTRDSQGKLVAAKKPTRWATTSEHMVRRRPQRST